MNIDQQLASLLTSLDDVLDLERGLADAMLPRRHAELVSRLGAALDVEAGLARVVPPTTGLPLRELDGFVAFAREIGELPAARRLATRTWLPVSLLVEAYILAEHVPTVRALAEKLHDTENFLDVRSSARKDLRVIIHDLDRADLQSAEVRRSVRQLLRSLMDRSGHEPEIHILSRRFRSVFAGRLAGLLAEINRRAQGHALSLRISRGLVDVAFADALLGPLGRLVSALTDVVGADLTSADLGGIELGGVRWSSDTRWPSGWQEWVRDNSVAVSPDVFEIRQGKAGSWLPT